MGTAVDFASAFEDSSPGSGGSSAPASIRLALADATLYDPNATLVSALQDVTSGAMAITVTGGRDSDDPKAAATWVWPLRTPAGVAPEEYARWVLPLLLTILRYPGLKYAGDTWVRAGICTRGDPASGWSARGYGFKWLTAAGAPRIEEMTVSASGAPTMVSPTTAQYTARSLEMGFLRVATGQNILPIAQIVCDGSGTRTGTDLTTSNSLLTFGQGVELGIFLSVGRKLIATGANDTVYCQLDTLEISEWLAAAGKMEHRGVLNVLPLGDSITQGTGWNHDSNGELFGWRRKLEDLWLADTGGLKLLRFWGSNSSGGAAHGAMALGRNQHEGRSGFTSGQIDTALAGYITAIATVQDVCVIGLGTNDAQNAVAAATFIANMQSIIGKLKAVYPLCKIVVSNIPTLVNVTHEATAATYRALLGTLTSVDAIVDDVTGLNTGTMLADGVHPNSLGYDLLASRRLAILREY